MPIPKDIPTEAEKMFENYLYRVKLSKDKMHPAFYIEKKRAFYAALGSILVVIMQNPEEQELHDILDKLESDVMYFWTLQSKPPIQQK